MPSDKQRLDWLDRRLAHVNHLYNTKHWVNVTASVGDAYGAAQSVRTAIDRAIQQEKGRTK